MLSVLLPRSFAYDLVSWTSRAATTLAGWWVLVARGHHRIVRILRSAADQGTEKWPGERPPSAVALPLRLEEDLDVAGVVPLPTRRYLAPSLPWIVLLLQQVIAPLRRSQVRKDTHTTARTF